MNPKISETSWASNYWDSILWGMRLLILVLLRQQCMVSGGDGNGIGSNGEVIIVDWQEESLCLT